MTPEEQYYYNKSSLDVLHADRIYEAQIHNLYTEQEYKIFSLLKPSLKKDGIQWCILYGENLQDGICGFGDTPYLAILDFNKAFNCK